MANDFTSIKTNKSVTKISLVRIQSAREIGASLSLQSGTTYTHTFHVQALQKIEVDGTLYTKVSSSPAAQQYTYNESTKELVINLGVAYSSQQVVCFFYLFFSKEEARIAPETPTNSSSTNRNWLPRIKNNPRNQTDFKDIQDGKLKYTTSSLVLFNQDHFFEEYIGDKDSFANKEIVFWMALDDIENVQISFKAIITNINVADDVRIDFDDNLSLLNQTFFSNGSYLSSTFNTSKFANMISGSENAPIRKLYSEITTYSVVEEDASKLLYKVPSTRLLKGVCTNYNDEITTSNNRQWGTILGEGDYGDQSDTVQAVSHSGTDYTLVTYGTGKKYRIGDTLVINSTYYVQVKYVDEDNDQFRCTYNASISTSHTISRKGVSCVVIQQNDTDYYPLYGRDYTTSVGTNDAILITFTNNFESTLSMNALDPNLDEVGFRAWADTATSFKHGDVIQEILERLDFDVNAASITEANLTDLETNFYIPSIDDDAFPTFGSVVESILRSTLGYITINNSLEIAYGLLDAPDPGTTDKRTDNDFIHNTFEIDIDYTNLYNSITPSNPHDILELDYVNLGFESNKATYLHGISKNREFSHVILNNTRIQSVLNLISERKIQYIYKIKTRDLDTIIGDDFELSGVTLPNSATSKDVTVLSISKLPKETVLISSDLLGL